MEFAELLKKKFMENRETPLVFITDEELNSVEDLLTTIDSGEKVYDPILLVNKAGELGYWCEADYNEETGGYVFDKL